MRIKFRSVLVMAAFLAAILFGSCASKKEEEVQQIPPTPPPQQQPQPAPQSDCKEKCEDEYDYCEGDCDEWAWDEEDYDYCVMDCEDTYDDCISNCH